MRQRPLPKTIRRTHEPRGEQDLKFVLRGIPILILFALPLGWHLSAQEPSPAAAQSGAAPAYEISGSARSGKTPLPGATVIASNTLTGKKYTVVTNAEGKFSLNGIARGHYVVRIEFMGFAVFTQDLVVNPENRAGKIDAELILASRQQQQSTPLPARASLPAVDSKALL